eukprot:CAMPEP_0202908506 /NCGR_PEP_ID=MMETSP1392-20130828/46264_1 /ASSEMBLY_ACC=CAM_ASM_000868 /TAXON_ID=225041 /ORGANISM="Chlamydomonas chlamydogama, Strain SAG 11-48b" /LENGTH=110 /DNA_ID=CAMNT_0049597889 /DNA_START=320 /DNA_END=652 /DNA_ORIENTATION=-
MSACAAWQEQCFGKPTADCTRAVDGQYYSTSLTCWDSLDSCRQFLEDPIYRAIMVNLTCCTGQECNYPTIVQRGGGIFEKAAQHVRPPLVLLGACMCLAALLMAFLGSRV